MTTLDNTTQPGPEQPTAFGWCAWHGGNAEGVRLIRAIEQGSGPGGSLFACPPCRTKHRLVPLADNPLL